MLTASRKSRGGKTKYRKLAQCELFRWVFYKACQVSLFWKVSPAAQPLCEIALTWVAFLLLLLLSAAKLMAVYCNKQGKTFEDRLCFGLYLVLFVLSF